MMGLTMLPEEITGYALGQARNNYAVVRPEGTINLIPNPSFENATLWSTGWGSTGTVAWAANTDYASHGRVSAYQSGVNGSMYTNPDITLVNDEWYTFSVDVRMRTGGTVTLTAERAGQPNFTATKRGNGRWMRVSLSFRATASAAYTLRVTVNAPSHIDGAQLENKPYPTTYCDGDVRGFGIVPNEYRWDTVAHASISFRNAQTRHGGEIVPLGANGTVMVVSDAGLGSPPGQLNITDLYDGTSYVSQAQDRSREIVLAFALYNTSPRQLRETRGALIDLFSRSPSQLPQPILVYFYPTNAADDPDGDPVIIPCHYVDGLEGARTTYYSERIAIRLRTTTPYFTELYPAVQPFGTFSTPADSGQVMYRDTLGEWRSVTPSTTAFETYTTTPAPLAPTAAVRAVDFLGETLVFGGRFVNLEGNAALDYLVAYDPISTVKSTLGGGVNEEVTALGRGTLAHEGKLFIGGRFTARANGTGTAHGIAVHPGGALATALVFPTVGIDTGGSTIGANPVFDFACHPNGRIYVVGAFPELSNGIDVPGFCYLDGTTYNAGLNPHAQTLIGIGGFFTVTVGPDEIVYIGGLDGMVIDGEQAGPVIAYDPARQRYTPLGKRLIGNNVYGLIFGSDGYLYAAGEDFYASSNPASGGRFLARFNGFDWEVLPPNGGISPGGQSFYDLFGARNIARVDNMLYMTGGFSTPTNGIARFIGGRVVPGDIILPDYGTWGLGTSPQGALAFSLFAGAPTGGNPWVRPTDMTAYFPLITTVNVDDEAEWDLYVVGPCYLDSFSNYTTNSHIVFNPYRVMAGDYARISLTGGRIVINNSRNDVPIGTAIAYADVPGRMSLVAGENRLQLALHGYNSSTRVSLGIRKRVRSFN